MISPTYLLILISDLTTNLRHYLLKAFPRPSAIT
jgi:hypothetical protein